ncbi:hypothetical protein TSOC_012399, partial [Tetrabaena socialis]
MGGLEGAESSSRSPCSPWWTARADIAAPMQPSCRDFSRVQRRCEMEKDSRTGRDVLLCEELRETFRLCTNMEPEKLSTTVIETREPLLEGHTLLATSRWELGMPAPDARELHAAASSSSRSPASSSSSSSSSSHQPSLPMPPAPESAPHDRPLPSHSQQQPSFSGRPSSPGRPTSPGRSGSPGRSYRPWNVLADDGGGYNSEAMLTPRVGQAVQDILQFADEMQQDLAQHG